MFYPDEKGFLGYLHEDVLFPSGSNSVQRSPHLKAINNFHRWMRVARNM